MNLSAVFTLVFLLSAVFSTYGNAIGRPEGWATCLSVNSAGDYDLTGGGDGSLIVLRNDGSDMRDAILDAVNTHEVVVFDGRDGDFELSSYITFQSLSGRTLIGVNGARLRTAFSVTQEIRDLLDGLDVNSINGNAEDGLGGNLSNGVFVAEPRELAIRQALIDLYGNPKEPYRNSGLLAFNSCSNIIVSNLDFAGPGSIDVGGADLITLVGCDHVWIDHCRFIDGMDGNLDIIENSDFITVSDTHFDYTGKSYNHPLSSLNSGSEITDGSPQKNNVSWIRCHWGDGCTGRMPFTVYGIHHLLNCYWDCSKGTCIDAHNLSRVLIEGCYFSASVRNALAVRDDNVSYEWRGSFWDGKPLQQGNATINVPYDYTVMEVMSVPLTIGKAGPSPDRTFSRPLSVTPAALDFGKIYAGNQVAGRFSISSFESGTPARVTLTAPDGVTLSTAPDGDYSSSLLIEAVDAELLQSDVYIRATFSHPGEILTFLEVSAPDGKLNVPVKAEVVGLDGQRSDATLLWPLDKGAASDTDASTAMPEAFSMSSFGIGDKIYIHSSKNIGGALTFTLFNPTEAIGKKADEACCIAFDVVTAPGYVFVPKTLKLNASRISTDMCSIDIECSRGSGTPVRLLTGFQPCRSSNSPSYSKIELPLGNAGVGESLCIKIYLYNMSANKQLALGNVRIEGDVYASASSIQSVPSDETTGDAVYYDLTGRRVAHPQSGHIYVMHPTTGTPRLVVYH